MNMIYRTFFKLTWLALLIATLSACGGGDPGIDNTNTPSSVAAAGTSASHLSTASLINTSSSTASNVQKPGADIYAAQCASCHGATGLGGAAGGSLKTCSTCGNETLLADSIERTMPLGNPALCDKDCSITLAQYIRSEFIGVPAALSSAAASNNTATSKSSSLASNTSSQDAIIIQPTSIAALSSKPQSSTAALSSKPTSSAAAPSSKPQSSSAALSSASSKTASSTASQKPGADLYAAQCSICHGNMGEGGPGGKLDNLKSCTNCGSELQLADVIEKTMPQGNPGKCDKDCSLAIAQFIRSEFIGLSSTASSSSAASSLFASSSSIAASSALSSIKSSSASLIAVISSSSPKLSSLSSLQSSAASSKSSIAASSKSSIAASSKSSTAASSVAAVICGEEEAKVVFTNNNCLVCHSATNSDAIGGQLNLATGDIGQRLLGRLTRHGGSACQTEKLIDPANSNNSLLLKLIDPVRHAALNATACKRNPMPQSQFMPANDLACVASWVHQVASTQTPSEPPASTNFDFAPANAGMALQKAKYILNGNVPTNSELSVLGGSDNQVNQAELIKLIKAWETTPEYETIIKGFLSLQLQQITESGNYGPQFRGLFGTPPLKLDLFRQNLEEMFTRTAWEIVRNNGDFRDVVTTRKWQVTTAILAGLVYADKENQTPKRSYLQQPAQADLMRNLEYLIDDDYSDWRAVEFTQSSASASYSNTAGFTSALRTIPNNGTLPLLFPRVGFFSTPSYLDLWGTNDDNDFRVTANQTLIVALNKGINAADPTTHLSENGIPTSHIDPDSSCYQCHRHLDPMRLVFKKYQYSIHHARNPDPTINPSFSFMGVTKNFSTIDEFAQILANHEEFAKGWVQKLCVWGNSMRCDESDPEFTRLANYFRNNQHNFKLLLRQFFSSPIFTGNTQTLTHSTQNFVVSISRGNHFCNALNTRIKALSKVNGTSGNPSVCSNSDELGTVSNDQFARATEDLAQGVQMSAFDTKSIDAECMKISRNIFATNTSKVIDETKGVDKALEQLVQYIIGIPTNDNRYNEHLQSLKQVYNLANHGTRCNGDPTTQGNNITCGYKLSQYESLRSAWFAACTDPELISLGM